MAEKTSEPKKPTTIVGWLIRGGGITAILGSLGFLGKQGVEIYSERFDKMEARVENYENLIITYESDKVALTKDNERLSKSLESFKEEREREDKVIWDTLTQQNDKIRDSEIKVGVMEKIIEQDRLVRMIQIGAIPPQKGEGKNPPVADKSGLDELFDEVKNTKKSTDSDDYRNIQQRKWSSKNGPEMQQKK
jgi:hypothetical protein